MTRKDYVLIAATLKPHMQLCYEVDREFGTSDSSRQMSSAVSALSDALARDNARFDRSRFLKACGVQS